MRCRYDDGDGNVDRSSRRRSRRRSPPARTYCSSTHPSFPSVGTDGDMFGKDFTFQNGELAHGAMGQRNDLGPPTFFLRDATRDATTGWVTSSRDGAGLATSLRLRRPRTGHAGRAAFRRGAEDVRLLRRRRPPRRPTGRASRRRVPSRARTRTSRPGSTTTTTASGAPCASSGSSPAPRVTKRFTLYRRRGPRVLPVGVGVERDRARPSTPTSPRPASSPAATVATARPSAAPGTYRLCCDPFGRPQQVVGAKHSRLARRSTDRTAAVPYSDTWERSSTYCVNGDLLEPSSADLLVGRDQRRSTTTRSDAFGRITSVTEPTGDVHDLRLRRQRQGRRRSRRAPQIADLRARLDRSPALRDDARRRDRSRTSSIGSLGNVRQETRPGGVVVTRHVRLRGTAHREDAGGLKYARATATTGGRPAWTAAPGFARRRLPRGQADAPLRLQPVPTIGPVVDEQFEYGDAGGRLSKLVTTSAGNGGLSLSASQTWTYGTSASPSTTGIRARTGGVPGRQHPTPTACRRR